jgi:hypothetical protein
MRQEKKVFILQNKTQKKEFERTKKAAGVLAEVNKKTPGKCCRTFQAKPKTKRNRKRVVINIHPPGSEIKPKGAKKMKKAQKEKIIQVCHDRGLSDFWAGCLLELFNLQEKNYKLNKRVPLLANITRVSRSGMSRRVEFGMIRKSGEYQNITPLFAALYGASLKEDGTFQVNGCGMDMIFHVIYTIFQKIAIQERRSDYNFFCRYERF